MVNKKLNLTLIIMAGWLFIVLLGYYLIHNPFGGGLFFRGLSSIWAILSVLILVTLSGGIGSIFLKSDVFHGLERSTLQAAFGFGVLALAALLVGSLIHISAYLVLFLVPFFSVIYWRSLKAWVTEFLGGIRDLWKESSGFSRVILLLIGVIFLCGLLVALSPPIKYDALNYHLTMPKTYLQNQKVGDIPWLVMSGMPQTTEMLYMLGMAFGGESAALVFNWAFGFLTVIGLVGTLKPRLEKEAAWVGAAALIGGFTLSSALAWGYVGWLSALFGLSAFVCLDRFFQNGGGDRTVYQAGLFAGLALSTKYPAGVFLAAGGLTLLLILLRLKKNILRAAALFAVGGLVFSLPWLIKNMIFTGNPLYPFFFESGAMDAVRISVYQGSPTFGDMTDLFLLPIKAFMTGYDGAPGYSVSTGPLLLGLGLLAVLNWSAKSAQAKKTIFTAGMVSLFGLVIWAVGNQLSGYLIQTRFYFVLFPSFSVLAAYGFDEAARLNTKKGWFLKTIQGLIILVLAFNAVHIIRDTTKKGALAYVLAEKTRQDYLNDNLGWYALMVKHLAELPEGNRVMMLYEPRGYGCVPGCDPDEILDRWKTEYPRFDSFTAMEEAWRADGYTHLLVYQTGVDFLRLDEDPHHPLVDLQTLDDYLGKLTLQEDFGGVYALFEIP